MPQPIGGVQPFAELARNGPTVVYKGYQQDHDRFVLLKAVRSDVRGTDLGDRLAVEATLAAQVRHPNVVAVFESGTDRGTAYLVTEFIEGLDLRSLLARGPLPVPLAVYVLREAAEGLRAVHANDILHRDLKPGNVLISDDGAVKLADFGLASLAPEGAAETRGTLAYLAPEVVRGEAPTPASDLFALGAVLVELLTGRAPFARESPSATLDAVLHDDPVEGVRTDPRVPPAVVALAAGLLAKDPAERVPSAMHLVGKAESLAGEVGHAEGGDLAAFVDDPDTYSPPGSPEPARPPAQVGSSEPRSPRRSPSVVGRVVPWLGALVLLVLLGYGALRVADRPDEPAADVGGDPRVEEALPQASVSDTAPPEPGTEAGDAPRAPPADSLPSDPVVPELAPERIEEPEPVSATEFDSAEIGPPAEPEDPGAEGHIEEAVGGSLSVAAEPWAEVRVGGERVGTTPLVALALPTGTHTVTLSNPEFPTFTSEVEVVGGRESRLSVALWDLVGRVTLSVTPWARVSVDGAYWDTVPPQERPLILSPGTHRLAFEHPTLGTREVELTVASGEERAVRVDLRSRTP